MHKKLTEAILLLLLSTFGCSSPKKEPPKPAQSIGELRKQIEEIQKDTHIPGVSVAIVHRDGPEWIAGIGKADVAAGRAANEDTLFRIGSVSKAFASLSILLLADEHKLSLDDPVHKLAPEVWLENRWESTDPIRVVHLLEHTTGWDDLHLREYALDARGLSLRDAFDFDHRSRVSRWRPGTRMSYCNSGPAVAAYIVEKITGQRFEDFVQQRLFSPIGMKTATYFQPRAEATTTLYHDDGTTAYPYWNIIYRPAGSINASARDMASYVQFYLNRGAVNGNPVLPATDIDRMETPTSNWAAKEGMKRGYGLSNYWSVHEGFVYHGHNGGVNGGLTEMSYLPENDAGYFYSINSDGGEGFERVGKAIRGYVTRKLQKPPVPALAALPENAADYAGWYAPNSPRSEMLRFVEQLAGLSLIRFRDGKLVSYSLDGSDTYAPVNGTQFRDIPRGSKDAPEPVASLILLAPNEDGRFFDAETTVMKQIPAWLAIIDIVLTGFVALAIVLIVLYAPFWILGGFRKSRRRPAERGMRIWPLAAVLSLLTCYAIFASNDSDTIAHFGILTLWSAGFCAVTIAFAVFSIAGAISIWRAPAEGVRRGVRRFSILVTAALLIATAYLAYWGFIGMRTWI